MQKQVSQTGIGRVATVSVHFVIMVARVLYILGYHLLRLIGLGIVGLLALSFIFR